MEYCKKLQEQITKLKELINLLSNNTNNLFNIFIVLLQDEKNLLELLYKIYCELNMNLTFTFVRIIKIEKDKKIRRKIKIEKKEDVEKLIDREFKEAIIIKDIIKFIEFLDKKTLIYILNNFHIPNSIKNKINDILKKIEEQLKTDKGPIL